VLTIPERESIASINSYASPSPVIEQGRVYAHFGTYGTFCLDTRTFEPIWSRTDLHCAHSVGSGSSPVLAEGRLILTLDGMDTQRTIALDPATGKTLWIADRSATFAREVAPDARKAFNTPVLVTAAGRPLLVCPAAGGVYAYDPATGREVWRLRHGGYSGASRTVFGDGIAYVGTGYDRAELIAVKTQGSGDITQTNVVWRCSEGMPYKPSPVLVDGLLYVINDAGGLTCLDAATGAVVWRERLGGNYSASPVAADGRIYLFNERGKGIVLKPGRAFTLLAENELEDGCMASPAVVGHAIYVRTKSALYRIEEAR
jgi:outer membrane protein assembly factor BamB